MMLSKIIRGSDIVEKYSPTRVNKFESTFGVNVGVSMDLTNGYDFDDIKDQNRAWKVIRESKPLVVIGSPPCTHFSMLQELNIAVHGKNVEWMRKFEEAKRKAVRHVEFCCKIYEFQLGQQRHFLHEHPWSARSWKLPGVEELLYDERAKV